METKTIEAFVQVGKKQFNFGIVPHVAHEPGELKMEVDAFYMKYTKQAPSMPHYEMEIITLPAEAKGRKFHIHLVNDKQYVCWTGHVPSLEKVHMFFKLWCLGTAWTLLIKIDFRELLGRKDIAGNIKKFEKALEQEGYVFHWKTK